MTSPPTGAHCGLTCPSSPQAEVKSPLPSPLHPARLELELTGATPAWRGPVGVLCPQTPTRGKLQSRRELISLEGPSHSRDLWHKGDSERIISSIFSASALHFNLSDCSCFQGETLQVKLRRVAGGAGRRVPGPSSLVLSWTRSCSTIRMVSGFRPSYPSKATSQPVAAVRETAMTGQPRGAVVPGQVVPPPAVRPAGDHLPGGAAELT